jgi:phosphatidylinositol transfer protein SFH5
MQNLELILNRNLSIRHARTMLVATLRWREQFNVEAAIQEAFPQDVFGPVGRVFGKDKGGRPVVYVFAFEVITFAEGDRKQQL